MEGNFGKYPSWSLQHSVYTLKASYNRKREIKMFLDNLSSAVLRLCDEHDLTYETASERCDLSSRYFGDIARRKTSPSITTLEKLCTGFQRTPNDLLIPSSTPSDISFRQKMPVTCVRWYPGAHGMCAFPVCPRCDITMEREYQFFCDRCGQRLDWEAFPACAGLEEEE